jgi:hypothetical protein
MTLQQIPSEFPLLFNNKLDSFAIGKQDVQYQKQRQQRNINCISSVGFLPGIFSPNRDDF